MTWTDRATFDRAERDTRDLLVAGPLLTAELAAAIGAARDRGARVVVTAEALEDEEAAAEFRSRVIAVLSSAPAGSEVVARWQGADPTWSGTISLTSDDEDAEDAEVWETFAPLAQGRPRAATPA